MERGTMLWFNAEKGFGFIRTDEDEKIYVAADGFGEDEDPAGGRCRGREVTFERVSGDDGPRAVNVRYSVVAEQRRARLRRAR